jgi:hypothetical protein
VCNQVFHVLVHIRTRRSAERPIGTQAGNGL